MDQLVQAFFDVTIAKIESKSIRAWASSDRNRPHVLKAIESALTRNPKTDPTEFATMLVVIAMG